MNLWHVLDAKSIWLKEFSSALNQLVPVAAWSPAMSWTGAMRSVGSEENLADPPLFLRHFPLQRGYSKAPFSWAAQLGRRQVERMRQVAGTSANSPLICTTPYYAPVAEQWEGPVVYYITDLTKAYQGADPRQVVQLDRRLCRVATLVCPNSQRIAHYLESEAGCSPAKMTVIPQATRASNLFSKCPAGVSAMPADIAHLPRPLAGVIGNLASNMDWLLIADAIRRTPEFSWVLVGPTEMPVFSEDQRQARQSLLESSNPRVVFTGGKPYCELRDYARCLDVALLPYQPRREPTYSGSSTRFYEHLAACRPMVATRGFEELLRKEPLLRLADTGEEVAVEIHRLQATGFVDGQERYRWLASYEGTWENRAACLKAGLEARLSGRSGQNAKVRGAA